MDNQVSLIIVNMLKSQAINELRECNDYTVRFGLFLEEKQILELVNKRFEALKETERIEFSQGILKKLIYEFCDSPYISNDNYEEILWELIDGFYYFKNESLDLLSDDELLSIMKKYFDTVCEGSLDYLMSTSLEDLCRSTRYREKIED